ncbi:unnamed protein product [Dovyalis caffra]|uniref:Mediator of RNA polymerase II transcription subunit 25 n=1 Tax=Dovyalis caffra TaxID=77055 RepID=A0AAV1SE88_9ROSI|nr:unnamed protein product [Dovyalis caffra]
MLNLHFCRNESIGQDASVTVAELGLVQYQARGPDSTEEPLTQPAAWTSDMNTFLQWLSELKFNGSSPDSSGIAEGLADALVMFLMHPNQDQEKKYFQSQRHCILVSATNPFGFVDLPLTGNPMDKISIIETEEEATDAESIAKLYIQFMVSLSVISPMQLPLLRKIYKAANLNSNAMDPFFNSVKNSDFLVLLSEKFFEAHVALCEKETTGRGLDLSEEDVLLLEQVLNQSSTSQKSTAKESISDGMIEGEVKIASFTNLQPDTAQLPCVSSCVPPYVQPHFSRIIPNLKTYDADDFASQEMIFGNSNAPRAIVLSQKARPLIPGTVNPSIILSHKAQTFQEATSVASIEESSRDYPTINSRYQRNYEAMRPPVLDLKPDSGTPNYKQDEISDLLFFTANSHIARSLMGMQPVGLKTTGKRKQETLQSLVLPTISSKASVVPSMRVQSIPENSFPSAAYNLYGSFKTPQEADYQTMHTMRKSPQATMSSAKDGSVVFSGSPHQTQNVNTGFTATGCNVSGNLNAPQNFATFQSATGHDDVQPREGKEDVPKAHMQQEEFDYKWDPMTSCPQSSPSSEVLLSNPSTKMPLQRNEEMEPTIEIDALDKNLDGHEKYIKAWEGAISALMGGRLMIVTRAVAYRATSTSNQITSDWPNTLQLGRLLCQDFFEKFPKLDPKYIMIFEVANNHSILEHLRTRKLGHEFDTIFWDA